MGPRLAEQDVELFIAEDLAHRLTPADARARWRAGASTPVVCNPQAGCETLRARSRRLHSACGDSPRLVAAGFSLRLQACRVSPQLTPAATRTGRWHKATSRRVSFRF